MGGQLSKREEAIAVLKEIVEARTKTLGPTHAETITAMDQIVVHLTHLAQNDEAMKMQTEVVQAKTKAFGPGHPNTLSAKRNLGVVLGNLGKYAEAVEVLDEALKLAEDKLGKDNKLTVAIQGYLDQLQSRLKAVLKNSLHEKP